MAAYYPDDILKDLREFVKTKENMKDVYQFPGSFSITLYPILQSERLNSSTYIFDVLSFRKNKYLIFQEKIKQSKTLITNIQLFTFVEVNIRIYNPRNMIFAEAGVRGKYHVPWINKSLF